MLSCQVLTEKLLKIDQNIYLLKMNKIPLKIKDLMLVVLLKKLQLILKYQPFMVKLLKIKLY